MKPRGFSIVELIIIITIMGILITLGVVNMLGAEVNSRDTERKTDIETIAQHLEMFYNNGNDTSTSVGYYPNTSTSSMDSAAVVQQTVLRDIDIKSLVAPNATVSTTTSLVVATNNAQTIGEVLPQPLSSGQNQYVYQPIDDNGSSLCTSGILCRKFNLYYKTESDGIVHQVKSINQ